MTPNPQEVPVTDEDAYAIRTVWREAKKTISAIERIMPTGRDWRRWIKDQGFRRHPSYINGGRTGERRHGWERGPCSSCGEVYLSEDIRDAVCLVCIECGGHRPSTAERVQELYGVDLEAEREAHRIRMAERAQGIRDPLPEDVRTRTAGGVVAGTRRNLP